MPVISTLLRRAKLENDSLLDPVQKFRVSQPEALIDTDFEYGLQTTKWESIELVNNIPTFFSRSGEDSMPISDVLGQANSRNIKVYTPSSHNFVVGSPFIITGLKSITAEGSFVVNTVSSSNIFVYKAKERQKTTNSIFDSYTTYLYPGSVYQSTQYTLENIEYMETDAEAPSKITVKTKSPSGFLNGTYFMLANSIGRKEVNFDASLIDPRDSFTTSFSFSTTAVVESGSGYKSKALVPYDYQSKKTVFFTSPDVNTTTNSITIPNHRLSTGTQVMYVAPTGDTAVAGLKNYELYNTLVVDVNTVQLREIATNLQTGLHRTIFSGYWAESDTWFRTDAIQPIGWDTGHVNFANIDYLGANERSLYLIGYFRPNENGVWRFRLRSEDASMMWFGANVATFSTTNYFTRVNGVSTVLRYSPTNSTVVTTGTATPTLVAGQDYPILIVYGQTSTASLRNLSIEWQAPSAVAGAAATGWLNQGTGYLYNDRYLHTRIAGGYWNGSLATFNSFSAIGENWVSSFYLADLLGGVSERSASIYGWFVPDETGTWRFRIEAEDDARMWIGDNALPQNQTDANNFLALTGVTATTPTSRTTENTISLTSGVYYPIYVIYGQSGAPSANGRMLVLRLRRPSDGASIWRSNWFNYVRARHGIWGHTTATTAVDITNQGTSTFGPHALLKGYLVDRTFTDARVQTQMNLTNYIDASLSINSPTAIFSLENTVKGFGVHNVKPSENNISLAKYTKYTLSTTPTVGASTTDILLSSGTPKYNYTLGKTWIVPLQAIDEYDAFFRTSHGLSPDSLVNATLASGALPTGITNNTNYRIEVVNTNYFRLKQDNVQRTAVDIQSMADGTITFTQFITNSLANTVYSEGHDFTDGTEVVYENKGNTSVPSSPSIISGSTYYVQNADVNTFTLTNASGTVINFTAAGTGTHTFISVDRATDGNYRIVSAPTQEDPYTFKLSTNFTIPFNSITFNPRECVNLNNSLFRFPSTLNANHRMRTGARVIYETNGNTALGGLADATSYYIISTNLTQFALATTYENALLGTKIVITSYGTGTNHFLHVVSVSGEIGLTASVTLSTTTNVITANTADIDFLGTQRLGDTIKVEVPETKTTLPAVSSINISNETITFASVHGLTDGTSVFYTTSGTPFGGLSNNYIYYVSVPSSTAVVLYNTPTDALSVQNAVDLTNATVNAGSSFYTLVNATIFTAKVTNINSRSAITVDTVPTTATAFGNFILSTALYPRSDGYFLHRPFDGGVEIVPSLNPGTSIIRQTRRYFRYQSGKGIQMSEAINFANSYEILSLTRTGDIATATTRKSHRLTTGVVITVTGAAQRDATTDYWNGTFLVLDVIDLETFRFDLTQVYNPATASSTTTSSKVDPEETTAGGFPQYTIKNWTGASIRVGLFDDQNGVFFEYDGDKLYAVLRNSVTQLPGAVTVNFNSSLVVGEFTKFNSQLQAGNYIVIRGMSYRVAFIEPNSDTRLYIQPPYRGISGTGVIVSKTIERKYSSSSWSVDKCDGTGPTGYILDVTRIQMVFIDYAWYGGGKVRYGFRMKDGAIAYCHEIVNNNMLYESYMRSGNLPGRFEVATGDSPSYVPALMHWGTSVIMDGRFDDDRAYLFTAAGAAIQYLGAAQTVTFSYRTDNTSVFVGRFSGQNYFDYQSYSIYDPAQGKTVTAYRVFLRIADQAGATNADKAIVLNNTLTYVKSGTVLTGSGGLRVGTTVIGTLTVTQAISGTAGTGEITMYIDRKPNYTVPNTNTAVFTNQLVSGVSITLSSDFPPSFIPLVSIRLAPSVDNGRPGALGSREIINRMQLTLDSVGILTTHDVEIKLLLNCYPYNKVWERVQPPSLSQLLLHKKGETISGGTQFFSFRLSGGQTDSTGRRGTNSTTISLADLATLGNSIIGGDDIFPNGPDLLTIGATIIDSSSISATSSASITGRITWTESQA